MEVPVHLEAHAVEIGDPLTPMLPVFFSNVRLWPMVQSYIWLGAVPNRLLPPEIPGGGVDRLFGHDGREVERHDVQERGVGAAERDLERSADR